jgi:uncharacterized protein YjbI with pentapeptide repeats
MTMADEEHLKILEQGVEVWNRWRAENPGARPNLMGAHLHEAHLREAVLREADLRLAHLRQADLCGADLSQADLRWANLKEANLSKADLSRADLSRAGLSRVNLRQANFSGAHLGGADLSEADLNWADLSRADLSGADLSGADLSGADLSRANLSRANLNGANLSRADLSRADLGGADLYGALLVRANLPEANLTGCLIYGISAWNLNLEGATQSNLVISDLDEPTITVDNLEVAQFIHLLLHNEKIRHIIDTITSKVVLILGRFTPERKAVLDALRDELRQRDYLPILFDFEKPSSRDLTETISTLAHMARFVIADITDAKSIPQELERIVPDLPSVPVQPLIASSGYEYGMFEHFRRYPWVLETYQYDSQDDLLGALSEKVISPAEQKVKELAGKT